MNAPMQRRFVSVAEAEQLTGLSRWSWRRWSYAGTVESVKISRRLLIPISEVERIVRENTRPRINEGAVSA